MIRFLMIIFINLNLVLSIATLIVQIQVKDGESIQDITNLGFASIEEIFNTLPVMLFAYYLLTGVGYIFVIIQFFKVFSARF